MRKLSGPIHDSRLPKLPVSGDSYRNLNESLFRVIDGNQLLLTFEKVF